MTNSGNYGGRQLTGVITEWEQKIKANSGGALSRAWNRLVKKYFGEEWFIDSAAKDTDLQKVFLDDWYEQLMDAGIRRDDSRKIVVEDYSIHNRYIISERYEVGNELIVEKPCWLINGKCIERGMASVATK